MKSTFKVSNVHLNSLISKVTVEQAMKQHNLTQQIITAFKQMKININSQQLQKIIQNFDINADNSIQFDEFILVLSAYLQQPQSQQWIFQAFQILDQDNDGFIRRDQLQKANTCYGLGIPQKQMNLIFEEGDPVNQGGICYQQFVRILRFQ